MTGKSKNAKLRARLRELEAKAGKVAVQPPVVAQQQAKRKRPRRARKGMGTSPGMNITRSMGSDILSALTVAVCRLGTVLWTRSLNPLFLLDTRIGAESQLWSRWRPLKFRLEMESTWCAPAFGLFGLGWTADPNVSLVSGSPSSVSRLGAFVCNTFGPLGQKLILDVPCESGRKWYETGTADPEEGSHGTLVLLAASEIGGFKGSMGVTLRLHWTVEFEGQTLPVPEASGSAAKIYPDAEWAGFSLFTTTDSAFSSTVLTIKAHPGGSAVTYSAAAFGVVYKIINAGALKYVNASSATVNITYASRAKDYGSPILVFHSTFADAGAYQLSGDTAKCLKYVSEGPWGSSGVGFESTSSDAQSFEIDLLTRRIAELETRLQLMEGGTLSTASSSSMLVLEPEVTGE